MVREESLRARYTEYKGGETKFRASNGPPSNTVSEHDDHDRNIHDKMSH